MVFFAIIAFLSLFTLLGVGFWSVFKVFDFKKPIRLAAIWSGAYIALLFLFNFQSNLFAQFMTRMLYYPLGMLLYAFLGSLIYAIVIKLIPKNKQEARAGYLFVVMFIITVAIANFHSPISVEEITVRSQAIEEPVSFIHITDTQLGSTSTKHFNKAWELAFAQDVDFIVFTGDLIDYDHYREEQFAILEESPVPIYFIRGNHEFMHNTARLTNILEQIPTIIILENEKITTQGINLIGIEYSEQENFLATQLETINSTNNFNLLLYHEPIDSDIAASYNMDLMLAGHTHAGQIWPLTLITSSVYPYYNGAYQFDQLTLYTSDGAGLWGPNMRLGTQNEIVVFTLTS